MNHWTSQRPRDWLKLGRTQPRWFGMRCRRSVDRRHEAPLTPSVFERPPRTRLNRHCRPLCVEKHLLEERPEVESRRLTSPSYTTGLCNVNYNLQLEVYRHRACCKAAALIGPPPLKYVHCFGVLHYDSVDASGDDLPWALTEPSHLFHTTEHVCCAMILPSWTLNSRACVAFNRLDEH